MEEKDKIIVKWVQEDVETSNNLLNKSDEGVDVGVTSGERKFDLLAAIPRYSETHFGPLSVDDNE